jgi:hypothetical protein
MDAHVSRFRVLAASSVVEPVANFTAVAAPRVTYPPEWPEVAPMPLIVEYSAVWATGAITATCCAPILDRYSVVTAGSMTIR